MAEYTKPKLRKRLKEEIQASGKGGRKGQWSARKAQLLVQRYEAQGGSYKGERDERQKHLKRWAEQDWHTASGQGKARKGDRTDRYLPDAAWKLLSKDERRATEARKHEGSTQWVRNTRAAREARAAAELLGLKAGDARKAVRGMSRKSELKRAAKAESKLGTARKTVLEAIEAQRRRL